MDIFDEQLFNQMMKDEEPHIEQTKCVTQNDAIVIFMWIYVIDLFIRFLRIQNWFTLRNLTYYIEQIIIRNLKNGNEFDDEHED